MTRGRWRHALAAVGVIAAMAAILAAMGRTWWCAAGDTSLWSSAVLSRHNSQHLLDPYTFTHMLHGLVYYAIVWALVPRRAGQIGRAWVALAFEIVWEIVENTDAVVDRYRATTISLEYYGDSVVNSIGDVLAFAVGYWAAGMVPIWVSIATFVLVDGALALWIRDGLVLNVLMLLHPIESIRAWQTRGQSG